MSNEIRLNFSLDVDNGNLKLRFSESLLIDQTTARGGLPGFLMVGTSYEVISTADLVSPGLLLMKNLDTSNFVSWGVIGEAAGGGTITQFFPVGKLKPGEGYPWRLHPSCNLYMKADNAACPVFLMILDD